MSTFIRSSSDWRQSKQVHALSGARELHKYESVIYWHSGSYIPPKSPILGYPKKKKKLTNYLIDPIRDFNIVTIKFLCFSDFRSCQWDLVSVIKILVLEGSSLISWITTRCAATCYVSAESYIYIILESYIYIKHESYIYIITRCAATCYVYEHSIKA